MTTCVIRSAAAIFLFQGVYKPIKYPFQVFPLQKKLYLGYVMIQTDCLCESPPKSIVNLLIKCLVFRGNFIVSA